MCLGIPAQLVAGDTGHPDLAMVDMGGVSRAINVGLLDDRPGPGNWVLVHMGFALQTMTAQEARDALDALGAEREAADREADALEAAMDAAAQAAAEAMAAEAAAGEAVAEEAMAAEAAAGETVAEEAMAAEAAAGANRGRGNRRGDLVTTPGPDGPLMFVRYAYPPNALGYCGPDDFAAFREYAVAGVADQGLVQLARAFSGAWPYLELISAGCGIADPLDHRVVEAYWVGNDLLDRVPVAEIGDSMAGRFRQRVGNKFQFLAEGVLAGGVPHHSFHVFGVYPWVGLLGDDRKAEHALQVLDRCRIRWGKVTAVDGDQAAVEYRPLCWDGRLLTLGEPAREMARLALDGTVLARGINPGDWVSLHWDWVCDRLTQRQLRALRGYTQRHLDMVNNRVEHSGPLAVLG